MASSTPSAATSAARGARAASWSCRRAAPPRYGRLLADRRDQPVRDRTRPSRLRAPDPDPRQAARRLRRRARCHPRLPPSSKRRQQPAHAPLHMPQACPRHARPGAAELRPQPAGLFSRRRHPRRPGAAHAFGCPGIVVLGPKIERPEDWPHEAPRPACFVRELGEAVDWILASGATDSTRPQAPSSTSATAAP
jgi:hypothetical protein